MGREDGGRLLSHVQCGIYGNLQCESEEKQESSETLAEAENPQGRHGSDPRQSQDYQRGGREGREVLGSTDLSGERTSDTTEERRRAEWLIMC